ncbi:MAG TPA: ABC transporter substrate-binding protein, partial [Acidimicrobiales bacterium]
MTTLARNPRRTLLALTTAAALLAACGDDNGSSASTTAAPTTTSAGATSTTAPGVSADGISADRCEANKKAGKITYLSGFDFAASAGIVEVVVAADKGYFEKMCLDVELKSSFSTANYPLVAANQAQFASAGSYSEMLSFATRNDAEFVAVWHGGKTGIDALLVKPDSGIRTAADVKGKTLGMKGALTASVQAMLAKAGLKEGTDFKTVVLDGFDPKAHIAQDVAGFPVYKSNEPGQLKAAGIPFEL